MKLKITVIATLFFVLFRLSVYAEVTYTVNVPAGTHDCFLAGEMTGWAFVEMNRASATVYTLTLADATTAQQYKYCSGPSWDYVETTAQGGEVTNRTYAATDYVANWQSVWDDILPPNASSGTIDRIYFESDLVDNRFIDVWKPSGYNTSQHYNVLYMQDGQMLFDASTSWNGQEWNVDGTLGNLIANGTIEQTIVVGIHNNGSKRKAEFFPQKVYNTLPDNLKAELDALYEGAARSDQYVQFVAEEVKPYIDAHYSTNPDFLHTFIGGSSSGSIVSVYAFCEYPDVFSRGIFMSTHWMGVLYNNSEIPTYVNAYLQQNFPSPEYRKIYFDYGSLGFDQYYGTYQSAVNTTVQNKGYTSENWMTLSFPGADHNETSWNARFSTPASYILSDLYSYSSVEKPTNSDWVLSPNLVDDSLILPETETSDTCFIYTMLGEKISAHDTKQKSINVSNLKPGMYILKIGNRSARFVKR